MAVFPKLPGIPSISPVQDQTVAAILRPMKESLEILSAALTGDPLANASTITSGVSSTSIGTTSTYDALTDYTPPPAPTGFTASGSFVNVILTWNPATYINHAYTEIWRSSTNVLGVASLIGFCPGSVYSDSVGNSSNYYYWIRFVSQANVDGPYNSSTGTLGATATDPAYLLSLLANQITTSQLATGLNTRINLIDAPTSTAGSVNARINVVQSQVNDLLSIPAYVSTTTYTAGQQATYSGSLYQAIATTTGHLPTDTAYWTKIGDYTSLGDAVAANTISISNLGTSLGTEVTARSALASQLRGSYTGTDLTAISSGLLYDERTARASADSAMASQITTLTSNVATNAAAILTESNTRASADSAMAGNITTLTTTVGGHTTSISSNTTSINGIRAMYTVKIDNNGKLSGFGLSSDIIDSGTSTSKFLISVDQFAVIAPGATVGTPGSVPFAVLTSAQTINGVSFAAGVYIDGGSIVNASITNAKIGALAVDTANIANSAITSAKIGSAQITLAKIDTASITSLSALSANMGTVTAGTLTAGTTFAGALSAATGTFAGSLSAATGTFAGSLSAATGTFAGSLSAATGSFAGSLSAATGSFAGSLSAATGSFSGTLSAASGTFDGTLTANVTTYAGGGSWLLGFTAASEYTYVVSGGMVATDVYTIPVSAGKKYVLNAANPKLLYSLGYGLLTNTPQDIGDAIWTLTMVVDGFSEGRRRLCCVQVPTQTIYDLYYYYSASPPYYTNAEVLGGTRGYDLPETSITHAFCRGTAAGTTLTVTWYLTHNTTNTINTLYKQWIGEKIMYINTNDSWTWKKYVYRGTANSGNDMLGINVSVFSTQYA